MQRDKKQEWATYRRLNLQRQQKSKAKRAAVDEQGIYCYVGGDNDRPWLRVLRTDYLRILHEELMRMRESPLRLGVDDPMMDDLMRGEVERRVYDRLLTHQQTLASVEAATRKNEGRCLTSHELSLVAKMVDESDPAPLTEQARADRQRQRWVRSVVTRIGDRCTDNPRQLEQVWLDVVGPEDAGQVRLTHIDKTQGIAYCQSLNPTVSYRLRRRSDLAEALGSGLGIKIKKVVFR